MKSAVSIEFEHITRIKEWPSDWLGRGTKPGDVLVFDSDAWGLCGGILRCTRSGVFITLSRDQLFLAAPIPLPNMPGRFAIIDGDQISLKIEGYSATSVFSSSQASS